MGQGKGRDARSRVSKYPTNENANQINGNMSVTLSAPWLATVSPRRLKWEHGRISVSLGCRGIYFNTFLVHHRSLEYLGNERLYCIAILDTSHLSLSVMT